MEKCVYTLFQFLYTQGRTPSYFYRVTRYNIKYICLVYLLECLELDSITLKHRSLKGFLQNCKMVNSKCLVIYERKICVCKRNNKISIYKYLTSRLLIEKQSVKPIVSECLTYLSVGLFVCMNSINAKTVEGILEAYIGL